MNTASQPVIVFSPNQTFPSDITPDPDNLPDATLNSPGIVQLSSAVDSDVETKASTPKATKEAFDKGVTALNAANSAASAATTAQSAAEAADAKAVRSPNRSRCSSGRRHHSYYRCSNRSGSRSRRPRNR